jgi:hypothetical protein
MRRTSVMALFARASDARAALIELRARFSPSRSDVHVFVRAADAPSSDLRLAETDGRRAMMIGVAWGALGGLVAVFVGAVIGLRTVSVDAPTIAFAVVAGTAIGVLAGALLGSSNPSVALEKLSHLAERGAVVVTVEAVTANDLDNAEAIFLRHAGRLGYANPVEPHHMGAP